MRTYEKMDAYKVSFNATEQVAAAACTFWQGASKYTNVEELMKSCEYTLEGDRYVQVPEVGDYSFGPAEIEAHPEWYAYKYRG